MKHEQAPAVAPAVAAQERRGCRSALTGTGASERSCDWKLSSSGPASANHSTRTLGPRLGFNFRCNAGPPVTVVVTREVVVAGTVVVVVARVVVVVVVVARVVVVVVARVVVAGVVVVPTVAVLEEGTWHVHS